MNTKMSKPQFVDTHFHVFDAAHGMPGARYLPAYDAPFERWRKAAAAVGVLRGVLVQTSFLGTDNRRLLAELNAHPQLLRGVAVVAPDASRDELLALHAAGVCGTRLNLAGGSHEMAPWRGAAALWDALLELGWHVELHTDRGALPAVLQALPAALPVVIDHMAKPAEVRAGDATLAALSERARRSAVHVKLSGAYRLNGLDPAALARLLAAELGDTALLWGSDWPCTNHEAHANYTRLFAALQGWVGPGLAEAAASRNPLALYWGE
jgi:predicted TIM-barrel fold metal-dependent hydrolase